MDPAALARLALLSAILSLSATSATPPAPTNNTNTASPSNASTYTVQAGDTLYSIALKFNTTIAALQQANNITNPNTLAVGQRLVISGTVAENVVTPSPTARGPTQTTPPQSTTSPTKTASNALATDTYIVKAGDTLATIAVRFGVTVAELQRLNNLSNPNLIAVGQRLLIPAAAPAEPLPDGVVVDPSDAPQGKTIVIKVTT
ncbi:MAG TPA: LysM domain-containing protein, partial [Anaerolineae bacterium]|nr:LysM domain-containing protein [Anaerolineae bacterium]